MKIKDGNYINIQSFMVKDLKLKGNELLVYAIIYGFSQNGEDKYTGSIQYLADWTNSTKQGIMKCLKSLVEKCLIEKNEIFKNGVKFVEYNCSEFTSGKQSLLDNETKFNGGSKQSLPNNIINNIENNNIIIKENIKEKYFENDELNETFIEYLNLRKKLKAVNSDRAIKMLINELNSYDDDVKIKMLEQSIVNSWKSVYPLKNQNKKTELKEEWEHNLI